jgi:hypothetical protein
VSDRLRYFLLVFDQRTATVVRTDEFTSMTAALDAYGAAEREHWDDRRMEVVLLGSDSLETVKITHANYFRGSDVFDRFLVDR